VTDIPGFENSVMSNAVIFRQTADSPVSHTTLTIYSDLQSNLTQSLLTGAEQLRQEHAVDTYKWLVSQARRSKKGMASAEADLNFNAIIKSAEAGLAIQPEKILVAPLHEVESNINVIIEEG
ncbi:unnamed protein product, partial [Prorocentrum cordatum]